MATTSIWDVRGWIGKVILYADNPEKTQNPEFNEGDLQGLRDVMNYAMNDYKTEKQFYVSGINCDPAIARQQMIMTKKQFCKEGGIVAYHGYQSFAPGEVTPDAAHKIGVALAERLWGERFEVIVATHLNTNCYHNHFVINSVSFMDGKRYYDNKATYALMRKESDRLCREYGLSVVENPERRGKHYAEWKAEKEGKPTWRGMIRKDVDKAIIGSMSFQAFLRSLREQGYEAKTGVKHIAVRPSGKERFVRLRSLGDWYAEEAIKQRILKQKKPEHSPKPMVPKEKQIKYNGTFTLHKITWKGLRALYFHYLHMLHRARRSLNEAAFLLREDLIHLDKLTAQAKLLGKNKIDTAEQLEEYRAGVENQIEELTTERRSLTNESRKAADNDRKEEYTIKISDISRLLKPLRKERKLCDDIVEYSILIKEKEEQLKQSTKGKEMKEYESGRCSRSNREHGS